MHIILEYLCMRLVSRDDIDAIHVRVPNKDHNVFFRFTHRQNIERDAALTSVRTAAQLRSLPQGFSKAEKDYLAAARRPRGYKCPRRYT